MPDTVRDSQGLVVCGGARAGGGCQARIHQSEHQVEFSVRGSAYGEATAESTGELRAEWFSTELYGEIPEIGPVIFRYRKDRPSSVVISSKQEGSDPFFPARAVQTLFYEVEVQNADGSTRLLRNEEPMLLVADIDAIPPNGTRFKTEDDVVFVDPSDPATPVFTMLAGSPGEVDDPGGLAIRLLDDTVESTQAGFSGEFEVTATAEGTEPGRITTFATTVGGANLVSPSRIVADEFAGTSRFPLNVEFGPGEERSGVIVHAFAAEGPPAEAHVVHMFNA